MANAKKKKNRSTKKTPRKVSSKQIEPLKENAARAAVLNGLASNINSILKKNSYLNKHKDFYFKLLKSFLTQPTDNRFVLLNSVNRMDLHPRYNLGHVGGGERIDVKAGKENFIVKLKVQGHPQKTDKVNCYCYQLLLLTWNNNSKEATYARQFSDWIDAAGPEHKFNFSFKLKRGVVHWMLCLMKQLGHNNKFVSVKLQGMRIEEVGTFDKNDLVLLKQIVAEEKKKLAASVKGEEEIVRVKPATE